MKLGRNQIQTASGIKIINALKSSNITILDLSWNSLGQKRDGAFGKAFRELLLNEKLKHADISYNSFVEKDIKEIEIGIKDNHTLWGIHVIGNEADVDSEGFVYALKP